MDAGTAPLEQLRTTCQTLRDELTALYKQRGSPQYDENSMRQRRWRVVLLLSTMKSGLRDTFLAADARRTCVQEQKDVAEAHQLQLQNLLYEKDHLLREIGRCRGFNAKEMDKIEFVDGNIPITADVDVHRQHLDQLTQELELRKRGLRYTIVGYIARSLQAELKQLKLQVVNVETATKTKRAFLDSLPDQLAGIEAATMGLQKFMGNPVTAQRKRREAAELELATPLYALYCELEAYQIASGDAGESLRLEIVDAFGVKDQETFRKREFPIAFNRPGRSIVAGSKRQKAVSRSPSAGGSGAVLPSVGSGAPSRSPSIKRGADAAAQEPEKGEIIVALHTAEKLLELRPHASLVEDEETKEVDVEPKHSCLMLEGSADASTPAESLWTSHVKALQLTVSVQVPMVTDKNNDATKHVTRSFAVMFQYFPVAKIVTAEVVKTAAASYDPSDHQHNLLMNLFPGDDGLTMPRLAVNYAFEDNSDKQAEVEFPVDATCRPYFWAQWICGLNPIKRPDQSQSDNDVIMEKRHRRPEPSIRNVMNQLVKRFVATTMLKKHLNLLAKSTGRSISPIDDDAHFVHPLACQLFPREIKTHLEEWKEVSAPVQDVFQLFGGSGTPSSRSHAHFHLSTTGCRYFRACFKNGGTKVSAMVEISPEYPVRAPRFIFQPRSSTSSKAIDKDHLPVYENRLKGQRTLSASSPTSED
uniref:Uncharacterized protein n=1 Tax=Hyaloperonospora arabidopsidis (strain Emoy2) TaxID=559515 RepID=M4BGU1_HYAAE